MRWILTEYKSNEFCSEVTFVTHSCRVSVTLELFQRFRAIVVLCCVDLNKFPFRLWIDVSAGELRPVLVDTTKSTRHVRIVGSVE